MDRREGRDLKESLQLSLFNKTPIWLLIDGLKNRTIGSLIGKMPFSSTFQLVQVLQSPCQTASHHGILTANFTVGMISF